MRIHRFVNNKGFTLVEMLIVTVVFVVVIMIASQAFLTVLTKTRIVSKSDESAIEGVVGLEMFRHDLEQAGFGLFTEADIPPPSYLEAVTGIQAANYNDSPNGIPRAVVAGNNLTPGDDIVLTGTDYLAIKATTVAQNTASQKWTYINGVGASKVWGTNDFTTSDYVITVRQTYKNGELNRKLIYDISNPTSFSVTYKTNAADYADPFGPPSDAVQYFYYGIDDNTNPRAPFNRTDYYIKRTNTTPKGCAPGAGVLYKSVMKQADGAFTDIPIMDCVADMQVVFGWNLNDPADQDAAAFSNADLSTVSATGAWTPSFSDPTAVRKHLKLIKIYILAQDGGRDPNYVNTDTAMVVGSSGETSLTRTINLTGANYQNYRWKLYRIVVKPKNLN